MIAWLRRMLGHESEAERDRRIAADVDRHARVMAHAAEAYPGDRVIAAERREADRWKQLYGDRMAGRVQR